MRYHYQVVSKSDPADIRVDSQGDTFIGYSSYDRAESAGEWERDHAKLSSDDYIVKVVPVGESGTLEEYINCGSLDV
jgi:hypothetical protein